MPVVIDRKERIVSESNKKLARKIFEEIWNQGALPLADELYDADYVAHISHYPEAIRGVEAFKQFVALFQALHSDLQFTVEDQIAICRQKAGIAPYEPVKLYRFEVKRYK